MVILGSGLLRSKKASGNGMITEGLVLYLDAGSISSYPGSGVVWNDLSTRANNAKLDGASYNNGYMNFDGSGYIDLIPNATNPTDFGFATGDFATEIWAYVANAGLMPVFNINLYLNGIFIRSGSGYHDDVYVNNSNYPWLSSYSLNTWNQIVLSRISGQLNFYINTINAGTASNTSDLGSIAPIYATLGVSNHSTSEKLIGRISIVRIYKGKGLTEDEILQNFNADKVRYSL